ncbi:MAG TPA: MarR family transcriptional regulator [Woeseiaceae bacterium]|nr:MarR family transcriptional regulator [Woeseiaceae bacterium]
MSSTTSRGEGASPTSPGVDGVLAPKPNAIIEVLEQVLRAVYSQSYADGLNPAQWSALRYIHRANPSARTPSAFAKFHMSEKSSASQTISALVRKGLVTKVTDTADRRVVRLELTSEGDEYLKRDPQAALVEAVAGLAPTQQRDLAEAAEALARSIFFQLSVHGIDRDQTDGRDDSFRLARQE